HTGLCLLGLTQDVGPEDADLAVRNGAKNRLLRVEVSIERWRRDPGLLRQQPHRELRQPVPRDEGFSGVEHNAAPLFEMRLACGRCPLPHPGNCHWGMLLYPLMRRGNAR